mgnify:CR=1 FL=1
MSRFPTAQHLASWARLCPGNNESAGKRKTGKTGKTGRGNPWLRTALVQPAQAAGHTDTYLAAQLHRLSTRRGRNKAVIAVADSILVIAYHVLKNPAMYANLGQHDFDDRDRDAVKDRPSAVSKIWASTSLWCLRPPDARTYFQRRTGSRKEADRATLRGPRQSGLTSRSSRISVPRKSDERMEPSGR